MSFKARMARFTSGAEALTTCLRAGRAMSETMTPAHLPWPPSRARHTPCSVSHRTTWISLPPPRQVPHGRPWEREACCERRGLRMHGPASWRRAVEIPSAIAPPSCARPLKRLPVRQLVLRSASAECWCHLSAASAVFACRARRRMSTRRKTMPGSTLRGSHWGRMASPRAPRCCVARRSSATRARRSSLKEPWGAWTLLMRVSRPASEGRSALLWR
mmetsp:Transcript_53214/g.134432  ORF Transcript_53214/g.134432 Transcript_53214/m.134432 type:complete len:217 (-) Transcript_53214:397-1047(-)